MLAKEDRIYLLLRPQWPLVLAKEDIFLVWLRPQWPQILAEENKNNV